MRNETDGAWQTLDSSWVVMIVTCACPFQSWLSAAWKDWIIPCERARTHSTQRSSGYGDIEKPWWDRVPCRDAELVMPGGILEAPSVG